MSLAVRSGPYERGAALVTVLVMLVVMSVLAIVVVDAARLAVRRTANQALQDQTYWYVLGAERFAVQRAWDVLKEQRDDAARPSSADWQGRAILYPLDDGAMVLRFWDGSNCFNLNSLVEDDGNGGLAASLLGQAQFIRLLQLRGVREPSPLGLAAALSDWLDSDTEPSAYGVEDQPARGRRRAYRTANTLMGDVGELASVQGFNQELVARLANDVCVRETAAPNALNINTLRPDQDTLLAIVVGPELPLARAREILEARPRGGWTSQEAFLSHPALSSIPLSQGQLAQLLLTSRFIVLTSQIERGGDVQNAVTLLDLAGRPRIVRRIIGPGVSERSV